jgi:MFS superfamily sulfate permease-like transporter
MLGVLIFDTLPGLVIGIAVSMLLLLYRSSRPNVTALVRAGDADGAGVWVDASRHPEQPPDPEVLVVRVESGLYFANADHVRSRIQALRTDQTRFVVLDGETTPTIDVSAAEMLSQLSREFDRAGVKLLVAHDIGQVRDVLDRTDDPAERIFPTVDAAVAAAHADRPDS